MNQFKLKMAFALSILFSIYTPTAMAYVDCPPMAINRYYVGDKGWFWIHWENGGAAALHQSNPDFKYMVATVMLAVASNRKLIVRYADGTPCDVARAEPLGMYLFQ